MTKIFTFIGVLLIVVGLAYHFAALEIFNFLMPKDAESRLVHSDVAYGPDERQRLDVYAPVAARPGLPIVIFVHGGSWQDGNKNGYAFAGRALAAQGFVTLVINYRLHPKDRYPAFVEDVALALRWAADNANSIGGDANKIFAVGHSAGGYNVAMAVLDDRFAAMRPKVSGVVTLAGPFDFLPLDAKSTIAVFGGVADLPATQPINHVKSDAPPFLILHGDQDTTVRLRNPHALHKALLAVGARSTLKVYEGVSHVGIMIALAKPLRSTPVLDDITAFIRDKSQ